MDPPARAEQERHEVPRLRTGFFTVADAGYFPGLVGLLNSLRISGHNEPLLVIDAGLTDAQRGRLEPHVTLLPAAPGEAAVMLAPRGPLQAPADVAVLIDADIVVLGSLEDTIERARGGRVVGFVNNPPNDHRSIPEWGPLTGLGQIRPQPYLNSGLVVVPHEFRERLLEPWVALLRTVEWRGTRYGGARLTDPFYFPDQDVLNALLASRFAPDEVTMLEHRLAPHPPFRGVRLMDPRTLDCRYDDGVRPLLLHHTMHKPWLRATRTTVYSRLLSRLLLDDDVPLQLRAEELPPRLREGIRAELARRRDTVLVSGWSTTRRQLGRFGIRTRIADARAHRH